MAYTGTSPYLTAAQAQGKNTNAIMADWVDRGPYIWWDTFRVAAGVTVQSSYSMFSIPIGQLDPLSPSGTATKTKLETNMQQGNSFPPPKCLLIEQIGFIPSGDMLPSDWIALVKNCYIEFRIDDKIFHEGHLDYFPAGAGIMGVSTQTGFATITNGFPTPVASRRYGPWAKYIAPLQRFSLSILFPETTPTISALGPGLNVRIVLDGLTDRSVQ